jgi:hypothetical protein
MQMHSLFAVEAIAQAASFALKMLAVCCHPNARL